MEARDFIPPQKVSPLLILLQVYLAAIHELKNIPILRLLHCALDVIPHAFARQPTASTEKHGRRAIRSAEHGQFFVREHQNNSRENASSRYSSLFISCTYSQALARASLVDCFNRISRINVFDYFTQNPFSIYPQYTYIYIYI